jgi:hypothetical protein
LKPGSAHGMPLSAQGEDGWLIRFDHPYGRHARLWPDRVLNSRLVAQPAPGEIMVLDGWPGNEYGHVAFVEAVNDAEHWTVSHANMAAGDDYRLLNGRTIRLAKIERHGDHIAFEGRTGAFKLIGFLRRKS